MTFRELQERVCRSMELVPQECFSSPDDEWPALALIESPSSKLTLLLGAAATLPAFVSPVLRREHARKLASVTSGWMHTDGEKAQGLGPVRFEPTDVFGWLPRPTEDHEALLVVILDEERAESWVAAIHRDGTNPPTLGAWRCAGEPAGPIVDPLKQALR